MDVVSLREAIVELIKSLCALALAVGSAPLISGFDHVIGSRQVESRYDLGEERWRELYHNHLLEMPTPIVCTAGKGAQ